MRFLNTVSSLAIMASAIAASTAAHAQAANTTVSNDNILNLISPFLALNATTTGQQTLTTNLSQAIATNNNATAALQALAVSDKNLFGGRVNAVTLANGTTATYGVAANLAGGLPAQAAVTPSAGAVTTTPTTPIQSVGGLGAVLGPIFQRGVAPTTNNAATASAVLANTATLLNNAYTNFTSIDLGIAKYYFANGTTNGTTVAVAATGQTLPTANGYPNKTTSVYDTAYGVSNAQANQDIYGSSRPVQVAPVATATAPGINQFDSTSISGLTTNPSFPSGHTTYAYTDSILIGMLVPQDYQSMLLRASAYANSRIVLGVHYPLDIIASRALASYDLSQAFTNPAYQNGTNTTTSFNLATQYNAARPELQTYLTTQGAAAGCGATIAACSTSAANTTNDPYVPSAANAAAYAASLTYGLPTLTLAQAPQEAAPAGGPDASILLEPVYGGSTSAAVAIATSAIGGTQAVGTNGSLSTATINQIIVNTETNALAAFYGTSLSYWTRINLYAAAGYFSNVTGTLVLASTDVVNTPVSVASAGVLDANGTLNSPTTVTTGGTLSGSGTVANALAVNTGGILAPGSIAARTALLAGATGVTGTSLRLTGPLTMAAGSSLNIVATPTQATGIVSQSPATITGATVSVQTPTGSIFSPATTFDILQAKGVTGTFAGATTNQIFETPTLTYDTNDVFLTMTRNTGALAAAAATRNQFAVATALGNPFNQPTTGTGATLLNNIFSLTSAQQARGVFDQLSGEGIVATQDASIRASRVFTGALGDLATSWMTGGAGPTNSITLAALPQGALAYNASTARPSPIVVDQAPVARSYRVWATGFGGGDTISGSAGLAGETSSFYGGLLGLDYQIQPNILVGVAAGGSASDFNVASRATTGNVTGFHGGVYSLVDFGPFYGAGSTTVSSFSNTTTRSVAAFAALPTATEKASFSSLDVRTRAEFGRVFSQGDAFGFTNMKITPFVALEIASLRSGGFNEYNVNGVGNLVGLTGQGQTEADVPGFIGARFESLYGLGGGMVLRPIVSLAYLHEFAPQRNLVNGFIALPGSSFLVNGARPARDAAQTKVGFELEMARGVGLFANFDGEFSGQERVYGGRGGLRFAW